MDFFFSTKAEGTENDKPAETQVSKLKLKSSTFASPAINY